jgi:carboxymethylenebutenolidase
MICLAASLVGVALTLVSAGPVVSSPRTVAFESDGKLLHGLLYKPNGDGPFPAVLYNHGSAPGLTSNAAFDLIAPVYVAHGWAFFAPYRRGQGLSQDAGPYVEDEITAARSQGGLEAAAQKMVQLMSTEQLHDEMAGLAWLQGQPFVARGRIAVAGNSFGGIETVLGAAQGGYCAAIDASGGAQSWELAPSLRTLMLGAVQHAQAPIFFFQAENDYSLAPSRELYQAMRSAGKPAEIHLYARFGESPADGHSFAWRGVALWKDDVLRFLDQHCRP